MWNEFVSRVHPFLFFSIPRQALDALVFAKPSITIDDLFNKDDDSSFRFIEILDDDGDRDDIDPAFAANQIALMEGLRDLFRKEVEAKSTYVEDLLHFCTGQAFIPDLAVSPDYKVFIEFSHFKEMNALPSSHTCDYILTFPASAYGGNIDIFKKKMHQAMEMVGDGFDMA
jgi:hypothetical protein